MSSSVSREGHNAAATTPGRRLATELVDLFAGEREAENLVGRHLDVAATAPFRREEADEQGLGREALFEPQRTLRYGARALIETNARVDLRRGLPEERHRVVVDDGEAHCEDVMAWGGEWRELLGPRGRLRSLRRLQVEVFEIELVVVDDVGLLISE